MEATTEHHPKVAVAARRLPLPVQISVAGVSFRQDAVAAAYPGETLTIQWKPHPQDASACEVRGSDHRLLGYVPATLAPRMVATMGANFTLPGTVDSVVGSETLGLRIKVHAAATTEVEHGADLG